MELFRISRTEYAQAFNASGFAARWNRDNQFVIYASSSRSLALLESVVHGALSSKLDYRMMLITLQDNDQLTRTITPEELPQNWRSFSGYPVLQEIGSKWYKTEETLALKVPSVLVPQEYNVLINTQHQYFNQQYIQLNGNEPCFLDRRLVP